MQVFVINCQWVNENHNRATTECTFETVKKLDVKTIGKILNCEQPYQSTLSFGEYKFHLFCNPAGADLGQPNNIVVADDGTIVFGNVVLAGADNDNLVDLSEQMVEFLKMRFGLMPVEEVVPQP